MDVNHSSGFQFNDKLDIAFLNELFEGDIAYATVIFGDFIKAIPEYWAEVENSYNTHQITALRSAVHKTKTLFGYVGHTRALEAFQEFENICCDAPESIDLTEEFKQLKLIKETAQEIVEQEYCRLKQYHQ